jgi:hypothetical protein
MPHIDYPRVIKESQEELKRLEKRHRYSHLFHQVKMLRLLKSKECRNPGARCGRKRPERADGRHEVRRGLGRVRQETHGAGEEEAAAFSPKVASAAMDTAAYKRVERPRVPLPTPSDAIDFFPSAAFMYLREVSDRAW